MSYPDTTTVQLAQQLREKLAGANWPVSQARLFSQHSRLEYDQPSLPSWQQSEAVKLLDDAIRLLEAASIEREANHPEWQDSARKAAELLEWLAHPQTNPEGYPFQLLSAAAYQIAGYPARASGLLFYSSIDSHESQILRFLLKAEFTRLTSELVKYWSGISSSMRENKIDDEQDFSHHIQQQILRDTIGVLGVLCIKMRWGDEGRLKKALDEFVSIERLLLYGSNPYSWLLSKLTTEVISLYVTSSLRDKIYPLLQYMDENGHIAIERYLRQCYTDNKNIAWPSQIIGIEQLARGSSFTLCTPTGSGKTSVAELAIIQSLFATQNLTSNLDHNGRASRLLNLVEEKPLVIYLVPSRALAAEVEVKLARVLRKLDASIIITGLYGGTDWGPTDTWLTSSERTVLICTYEKGEALIRFLGPKFLQRVSLVVVDEAHSVQFDSTRDKLIEGQNRSLRLEMLGSRLFHYLGRNQGRVVALSAVATGIEQTLASWTTRTEGTKPVQTSYRSVRQIIGRLVCGKDRRCTIYNDIVDGVQISSKQNGKAGDAPFIPKPFDPIPDKQYESGPSKRLSPYVFWAAIHFAQREDDGRQRAVLISITQHIDWYAKDFLNLLDTYWNDINLPSFFQEPDKDSKLWNECLRSCEDYFGIDSYTYRLLKKGIVVHQGSMPGAIGKMLTELIQERLLHIVLATSTLSEGVNLPFETILIPSLQRWKPGHYWNPYKKRYDDGRSESITQQEFGNLIGRSGRPGYGTEGRSLVVVSSLNDTTYENLINKFGSETQPDNAKVANSALAELILYLEEQWHHIIPDSNNDDFYSWLEQTAPLSIKNGQNLYETNTATETLDTLDGLLLSALVEEEQYNQQVMSLDDLEKYLQSVWKCTYACYASEEEKRLSDIFLRRGKTLTRTIYPSSSWRRRLYCAGLPPRHGSQLITQYPEIKQYLQSGYAYTKLDRDKKIEFIEGVIEYLTKVSGYQFEQKDSKKGNDWKVILKWWMDCNAIITKKPSDITKWHKFVRENFIYRASWGIGSIVALASNEVLGNQPTDFTLANWPLVGLPWVVLWLKELLTWGTTEPIAAYFLANKLAVTRVEAEMAAKSYQDYCDQNQAQELDANERLNPELIKYWAQLASSQGEKLDRLEPPVKMSVQLERDFRRAKRTKWRVLPVEVAHSLYWYDPAGFHLASCGRPTLWHDDFVNTYDFVLDSQNSIVASGRYVERELTLD